MPQVVLHANGLAESGGTSLIQHNERLQDPLDGVTRSLKGITSKKNKVDNDHEQAAWVEFVGGLYTDPIVEIDESRKVKGKGHRVIVPSDNMFRCLQQGAMRRKRGPDVLRGVMPLETFSPLSAAGLNGQTVAQLYAAGRYTLRKGVVISRKRITRTRPVFEDWAVSLRVEVDPVVWDLDTLALCWAEAGRYVGLGDMRPIHGRFTGTIEEVKT